MTAEKSLLKRVVWVTGGGGSLGLSIAARLGETKSIIVITDQDDAAGKKAIQKLSAKGVEAIFICMDVCDPASVQEAAKTIVQSYSRIDLLVNCAGLSIRGESQGISEQEWDKVVDTNLKGTFLCSQAAGKQMIVQNSGNVINIGSTAAAAGFPLRAAYCASKAGVIALTKVLACEWAQYNIRVNCISPGHLRTPMVEDAAKKGFVTLTDLYRRIPLGRLGETEEIAQAVDFLSNDQAQFITGANLYVDGGWTALGLF